MLGPCPFAFAASLAPSFVGFPDVDHDVSASTAIQVPVITVEIVERSDGIVTVWIVYS